MRTTLRDDTSGDVGSDLLDGIEHYGNQFRSSQDLASAVKDKDEADALRKSKSIGWASTYMPRWKHILHSIADQVSQVPFSLTIKISSVCGTMCIHIKPPPTDQIWYGFMSMPELEWELESSVGDMKITNSHIASLISNRIKASLHQSLVLPNCESIPMSWIISEKDDWVPRQIAPFIWLNREPAESASRTADTATFQSQPGEATVSKAVANNNRANKSSPPASTRSDELSKNTTSVRGPNQEHAAEASTWQSSLVSSSGAPLEPSEDELRMPLLSNREFQEEEDASERAVVAGEGDPKRKRIGRSARVLDLGRRVGDKLEEKGKHMVEKMRRENARSNNSLVPDLERATPAPAPS